MNYEINKQPSSSGNRTMFFATINGKRIGKTNWARKYDAVSEMNNIFKKYGQEYILNWSAK